MAKRTDPVVEAIATEAEKRSAARTAPYIARRENLRDALNAAAAAGTQQTGRC